MDFGRVVYPFWNEVTRSLCSSELMTDVTQCRACSDDSKVSIAIAIRKMANQEGNAIVTISVKKGTCAMEMIFNPLELREVLHFT